MFTVRIFQNKQNDQTNTHLGTFDDNHALTLYDSDLSHLDWDTCVFQIYPTNTHTQTFYTLPDGQTLFLFVGHALLGKSHLCDEYIYFKPTRQPVYTLRLVVAPNAERANEIIRSA